MAAKRGVASFTEPHWHFPPLFIGSMADNVIWRGEPTREQIDLEYGGAEPSVFSAPLYFLPLFAFTLLPHAYGYGWVLIGEKGRSLHTMKLSSGRELKGYSVFPSRSLHLRISDRPRWHFQLRLISFSGQLIKEIPAKHPITYRSIFY